MSTDTAPRDDVMTGDEAPAVEPPAPDATASTEVDTTTAEVAPDVATVAAERDEYLDALRRLQAEFDNFRKRVRREQDEEFARAVTWAVDRLLPVLDALDAARRHHPEVAEPLAGVLDAALVTIGVVRIDPIGERFDPDSHEAVAVDEPDDGTPLTVQEVLRPGYRCRGQLVRPAMVRVGPAASEEPEG